MITQLPTVLLDLFEDRMESLLDAMVLEIKAKATAAEAAAAAAEADMKAVAAEAKEVEAVMKEAEAEVLMKEAEAVDFLLAVVVVEVLRVLVLAVAPVVEDSLLRLRMVVAAAVEAVEPVEPQVADQRLSLIDVYKMVALLVEVVQKMPPLAAPEPPIV